MQMTSRSGYASKVTVGSDLQPDMLTTASIEFQTSASWRSGHKRYASRDPSDRVGSGGEVCSPKRFSRHWHRCLRTSVLNRGGRSGKTRVPSRAALGQRAAIRASPARAGPPVSRSGGAPLVRHRRGDPLKVRLRFRQRSGPGGSRCTRASRPSTMRVGVSRGRPSSHRQVALVSGCPNCHGWIVCDGAGMSKSRRTCPSMIGFSTAIRGIGAESIARKNAAACPRLAQRSPAGAVLPAAAKVEMLRAAVGEERARRVGDHQIPAVVQDVADVADDVRARPFAAGPRCART